MVRYVKRSLGRFKPWRTALIAFPIGHAIGQMMLSGGALRYRMYTPAGFSAMEVGATVLICACRMRSRSALLLDLSLVFGADRLAPLFGVRRAAPVALGLLGLAKDVGYAVLVACARRRSGSAAGQSTCRRRR